MALPTRLTRRLCRSEREGGFPLLWRATKRLLKAGFQTVGLEVRRVPKETARVAEPTAPPPLFDDPLEALHYVRGGKPAAFRCPLEACVHPNALNFRTQGWHPFTAALVEYRTRRCQTYQGSVLEAYYRAFQPANALEAVAGFEGGPPFFGSLASHLIYLFPWMCHTVEEVDKHVKAWYQKDNNDHGFPNFEIEKHGFKHHGPVQPLLGNLEFERLTKAFDSIAAHGYDRRFGDVCVLVLKRSGELRYLQRGGIHRTAAMRALGYDEVPAMFEYPWIIDVADVEYWPQVRAGVWDRGSALSYVDHLFDFDARRWASDRGLLRNDCLSAPSSISPGIADAPGPRVR